MKESKMAATAAAVAAAAYKSCDPRDTVRDVFVSRISGETNPNFADGQVSLLGVIVDSSSNANTTPSNGQEELTLAELAERAGSAGAGKSHVYKLDDGTGVLPVIHFVRRDGKELERAAVLEEAVAAAAAAEAGEKRGRKGRRQDTMLDRTVQGYRDRLEGFGIGTLVSVTGRYRYQRGELVVMANHVQKVTDPNHETERILSLSESETERKTDKN